MCDERDVRDDDALEAVGEQQPIGQPVAAEDGEAGGDRGDQQPAAPRWLRACGEEFASVVAGRVPEEQVGQHGLEGGVGAVAGADEGGGGVREQRGDGPEEALGVLDAFAGRRLDVASVLASVVGEVHEGGGAEERRDEATGQRREEPARVVGHPVESGEVGGSVGGDDGQRGLPAAHVEGKLRHGGADGVRGLGRLGGLGVR